MTTGEPGDLDAAIGIVTGGVPGPGAVASALLFTTALRRADIDPQTQARLLKVLGDAVPVKPLSPGTGGTDRTFAPDALAVLVPSAAVVAAGLDPALVARPAPPVIWSEGGNELLVRVAEVHADLLEGVVVITVPVTCDETGPVDVTVSFVTGTPDQPAGGVATTEDHPRGPPQVVETWAEPLISFAWNTLVIATSSLSGAGGNDLSGRDLISAGLSVTADGLSVTPMARHTFVPGGSP